MHPYEFLYTCIYKSIKIEINIHVCVMYVQKLIQIYTIICIHVIIQCVYCRWIPNIIKRKP